ncbi:MAG TPA: HNH endonuclease [Allosphingosinicella sp.]|jgi:uncharacterized protein (TIGR02646 family)
MIRITKGAEPQILQDKAVEWTEAILDKLVVGQDPTTTEKGRYRHPDVKAALVAETNGKCAYCESKFLHVHHGDVEHMYPKSLDVLQSFSWINLTLACERCNQNKSDNDPYLEHIIDPYALNPEEHLTFLGAFVVSRGTVLGECTRELLKLHRADLNEERAKQLDFIVRSFRQFSDISLPLVTRRTAYQDFVDSETSPRARYSAMNKVVIDQLSSDLPPDVTT